LTHIKTHPPPTTLMKDQTCAACISYLQSHTAAGCYIPAPSENI